MLFLNWQECDVGLYGQRCSLTCGHCRDEIACNNVDGSCRNGCSAGRKGDKCDIGMYHQQLCKY